jgi:hypothetical protein
MRFLQIRLARVVELLESPHQPWMRGPKHGRGVPTRKLIQTSSRTRYAPPQLPSAILQHVPASATASKQLSLSSTRELSFHLSSHLTQLRSSCPQMPGFVPHLSNLELIRQAGIFYPRITDLTGEHYTHSFHSILISNYVASHLRFQSTSNYNIGSITEYLHFQFPYMIKEKIYLHIIPSFSQSISFSILKSGRGWGGEMRWVGRKSY